MTKTKTEGVKTNSVNLAKTGKQKQPVKKQDHKPNNIKKVSKVAKADPVLRAEDLKIEQLVDLAASCFDSLIQKLTRIKVG